MIDNGDDCIKDALTDYFHPIDSGEYIWGAGVKGISLLNYLLDKGIRVNGIINNDDKKTGNIFKGISVMPLTMIQQKNINVIIAIASEEAAMSVLNQITKSGVNAKVISYDNFCKLAPKLSWDYYRT